MKFRAATFPGNQRVKFNKFFHLYFAAFFARVSEKFRLNLALGHFFHKKVHAGSSAIVFSFSAEGSFGAIPRTPSELEPQIPKFKSDKGRA